MPVATRKVTIALKIDRVTETKRSVDLAWLKAAFLNEGYDNVEAEESLLQQVASDVNHLILAFVHDGQFRLPIW